MSPPGPSDGAASRQVGGRAPRLLLLSACSHDEHPTGLEVTVTLSRWRSAVGPKVDQAPQRDVRVTAADSTGKVYAATTDGSGRVTLRAPTGSYDVDTALCPDPAWHVEVVSQQFVPVIIDCLAP